MSHNSTKTDNSYHFCSYKTWRFLQNILLTVREEHRDKRLCQYPTNIFGILLKVLLQIREALLDFTYGVNPYLTLPLRERVHTKKNTLASVCNRGTHWWRFLSSFNKDFCGIVNISGSTPQGRNLATQKSLVKKSAKLPKAHFAVHEYLVWNQYQFGRLYIITKTFMSSDVNSSAEPWTHKHISFYASWRCALSELEITEGNVH